MTNMVQQFFRRAPFDRCCPSHNVWPPSEQNEDLSVSSRAGFVSTIHAPATGTAGPESGRRGSDPFGDTPIMLREFLACRPGVLTAAQHVVGAGYHERWRFTDIDGPHGTADCKKILRIGNFLMPKEFGPGAVGRVTEVVSQLAGRVPATRWL